MHIAAVERIVLRSEIFLEIFDALPISRRHVVVRFVQVVVVPDCLEEGYAAANRGHRLFHRLPDRGFVVVGNIAQRNAVYDFPGVTKGLGGLLEVGNRLVLEPGQTLLVAALGISHAEEPERGLLASGQPRQFEILPVDLDAEVDLPVEIGKFSSGDYRKVYGIVCRRRVENLGSALVAYQLIDAVCIGQGTVETVADHDIGDSGTALHVVNQTAKGCFRVDMRTVDVGHILFVISAHSFWRSGIIVAASQQQGKK